MTNQQILEQAIQKAIDNGWSSWFEWPYSYYTDEDGLGYDTEYGYVNEVSTKEIIFNADFAKAIWGEWKNDVACKVCKFQHALYDENQFGLELDDPWKYHLQQMVISEDPIKYLGENI